MTGACKHGEALHGSKLTRREVEQKLGLKGSEKEKKVNQVQLFHFV